MPDRFSAALAKPVRFLKYGDAVNLGDVNTLLAFAGGIFTF